MNGRALERFASWSVLALRANIARHLTGLPHREFCIRLADSALLQWFLQVGDFGITRPFAKSTSDRLARWVDEPTVRRTNDHLIALLAEDDGQGAVTAFGLGAPIDFDDIFFDSTCLKANIHFPVDWVLLRDAVRTLMKATVLIRREGLRHRMPQEPLEFLGDMNTLCMKMAAARRVRDGRRHRKKVLREMKALSKRIARHARAHLELLETRREETGLSDGRARVIGERIKGVLDKLPDAIKQAHERIIGGRRVANEDKILSLYDEDVNIMVRGKSGAEVEFGNKLWIGETREGIVADYKLYRDNPGDTTLVGPAIGRVVGDLGLAVKSAWGDRGLFSKANEELLRGRGIRSGLCPRDVDHLTDRLANEPGMREGLKRRAGTEARISIVTNVFMGRPARAKGFAHRELMVGWSVLAHNLWVVARLAEAERKRLEKAATEATGCRGAPGRQAA
jgi:hypothetical protein